MVGEPVVTERGVLTAPDGLWDLAVRRAEVIGPLARLDVVCRGAVDTAAAPQLGISRRVYVLVGRWRAVEGVGGHFGAGGTGGAEELVEVTQPGTRGFGRAFVGECQVPADGN